MKTSYHAYSLFVITLITLILLVAPTASAQDETPPTNETKETNETTPKNLEEAQKSWWEKAGEAVWEGINAVAKGISDFWSTINALWNGMANTIGMIVKTIGEIGNLIGYGLKTIADFFGKIGDPHAYQNYMLLKLMYPNEVEDGLTLGQIAERITSFYPHNAPSFCWEWRKNNDKRTLEDITPSGFLGLFSWGVFVVKSSWPIFQFILQNFVLIHVIIVISLLSYGMYKSVQEKDLGPLADSVSWIVAIFSFYGKAILWIIEKAINLAQAIAQWLDTIIPF